MTAPVDREAVEGLVRQLRVSPPSEAFGEEPDVFEEAADALDALLAERDALREAVLEREAELIYLRLYGRDGAVWSANHSKEYWRDKARAALSSKGEAG